jgi:phosphoglucosamine mutase
MRRLFGTDGIRGEAGVPPLDGATVSRIGAALVSSLRESLGATDILVALGCDTRESSPVLSAALAGGIEAAGGRVAFAGVVPTPAVAYLTRALGAAAGVSISASHNPWRDNGVKIFSGEGRKLPDEVEMALEGRIDAAAPAPPARLIADAELARRYVTHLVDTLPHRLDGLTVVVDAASGAASVVGPEAFRGAGARVVPLHVEPDGRNINAGSGALHPESMAKKVIETGADLGTALDGDADRIVAADGTGRILDGDDLLFLWTLELIREGRKPDVVVGTVMSNWGLEKALHDVGVRLVRTPVGDRYVAEQMETERALLGGEPSGHLIRADLTTTGDGILTGLHLAALVAASGQPLAAHPRLVHTPQVLKNVRVKQRIPFDEIPAVAAERERSEKRLAGRGRILLRYSGTEPLARVMVEGFDADLVGSVAQSLARAIQDAIGEAGP